jgi:hypothetical protein
MHTRAYAVHIPTPSRTRPPQHEPSTPPTHRPRRSCPAWARNLARTPAASRVSGTAPANTNTSKASQLPEEPRWPVSQPARNTSSRYPRTLTRPRPPAGLAVSHRSGARACARLALAIRQSERSPILSGEDVRACARAGYTWLPTYHALSTYVVLGTG